MGCLYIVQLEKFVLNATRRMGSGRDQSNLGTRGCCGTAWGSVTIVVLDARVQHQGTEQEGDENEEEREKRKGNDLLRQWSRQLRYQLRVQAVTRARRVKEERSGNRSVNVGGMTPVVCGPGIGRSRDLVMMIGDHYYLLLSAELSNSLLQSRARGCTNVSVCVFARPGQDLERDMATDIHPTVYSTVQPRWGTFRVEGGTKDL